MLSIFELVMLLIASFICVAYIQLGSCELMNKKLGGWILYTVTGAVILATMFKAYSEFIAS